MRLDCKGGLLTGCFEEDGAGVVEVGYNVDEYYKRKLEHGGNSGELEVEWLASVVYIRCR